MNRVRLKCSHAAVNLGRSLFPLFALALNLPENFFDDKVSPFAYFHFLLLKKKHLSDRALGSTYEAIALSSPDWRRR